MKIGILTYHAPNNFGANLQAYASSQYLESLGHEVKIINYLIERKESSCEEGTQGYAHWYFSQYVLKVTKPCFNAHDIYHIVKEEGFRLVLIGADAVWGKRDRERLKVFHADWLWGTELEGKVHVAAMSPAFMGTDYHDLSNEEKESFRKGLIKFSSINTRDEWTRLVVNRDIFGQEYIKCTNPDPVFLLNRFVSVEWKHPVDIEEKKYIILSLNKGESKCRSMKKKMRIRWVNKIMKLAHEKGLKVVELPLPDGPSGFEFDYTVPQPLDPQQWYLWIKNSAGFFGFRFHAIVSCLSAGTPFLSLDGYGKMPYWSRILNLFGCHRLDHRISVNSKIRNLLDGSGLEMYRINSTEVSLISPKMIIRKLSTMSLDKEKAYRDVCIQKFECNMQDILTRAK